MELLGGFRQIDGVVGDPLKVVDAVHEDGQCPAVRLVQVPAGELHQVGAQHILIAVRLLLHGGYGIRALFGVVSKHVHSRLEGVPGQVRHVVHGILAKAHGKGGPVQEPLVQGKQRRGQGLALPLLGFALGDAEGGQLHQHIREGEQHNGTADVEEAVDHGHVRRSGGPGQEGKGEEGVAGIEYHSKEQSANQIKIKMDEGGPTGVLAGPDGGQQGRDAGTDVLAHDDGDGRAKAHRPGDTQGLKDTHGSGGGLDHRRQQGSCRHAQDGIGEGGEDAGKVLVLGQGGHGGAHGLHAEHQDGEARQDGAYILPPLALSGGHGQHHPHRCQNGREGAGLQELQQQAAALNAHKGQHPGGHRGADVGAHDDAYRLLQVHNAGVDEAHHHDRSR